MVDKEENDDWKFYEEIVTILEGKINKDSKVVQNVNLPVIDSNISRTRQCDVVIYSGKKPRQSLSIVEVQKRNSKPDINTFNGWLEKMREVGAQNLFCVSKKGYPASVVEKAGKIGPTVRLLTLKSLIENQLPIQSNIFHNKLIHVVYEKIQNMEVEFVHLVKLDKDIDATRVEPHKHYFKLTSGETISVSDLADWHFFGNRDSLNELPRNQQITVGIKFTMPTISYNYNVDEWIDIRSMLINIEIEIKEIDLDWEFKEYKQLGYGDLAWSIHGQAILEKDIFKVVVPLTQENPSQYNLEKPFIVSNHDAFFSIGNSSIKGVSYKKNQKVLKDAVLLAISQGVNE